MRVISRKALKAAAQKFPDLEEPLDAWYRTAKSSRWTNLHDVRLTYPQADAVGKWTVFNMKGNAYRLIVVIKYRYGTVYIRHVLTHAEYTRGRWKHERRRADRKD